MTKEQAIKKMNDSKYLIGKKLKHRGLQATTTIVALNIAEYENDFDVNCSVEGDLGKYDDSLNFILKTFEVID